MCFEKNLSKNTKRIPKPQVADKNITVYKVINNFGWGWFYSLIINDKKEPWTKGFEYEELTPFAGCRIYKSCSSVYPILNIEGNAFHSKKTRKEAAKIRYIREKVVTMIIPKGALYYENDTEYVSNRIIYPK